ncbi:MAG: zinc metalloprotease HtpX [Phycisphaerales bacterium]|nr:MAG: zinc metalloprotease HtpX [Phycisphaerales bacterium]
MERSLERGERRRESLGETLLPSVLLGAFVAMIFAALACAWSWYGGDKAILRMAGAHAIEKKDDPQLFNVVEELSIAAGLPMPRVYLIHSRALNAFATGRDPKHASVAITTGLRANLNRDELAGVMAHEIAHIRHFDVRFAMLMATLVGLIVFACDAFLRITFYSRHAGVGRAGGGRGGKGGGGAVIIMFVVALLLAVIAPLLATLMQMAISRRREYLADAGAVELTRYPEGLASALQKLTSCRETLKAGNRATEHLFIVNPSKKALKTKHRRNSLFSTHPPIQERVNRLLALTR